MNDEIKDQKNIHEVAALIIDILLEESDTPEIKIFLDRISNTSRLMLLTPRGIEDLVTHIFNNVYIREYVLGTSYKLGVIFMHDYEMYKNLHMALIKGLSLTTTQRFPDLDTKKIEDNVSLIPDVTLSAITLDKKYLDILLTSNPWLIPIIVFNLFGKTFLTIETNE